MAPQGEANDFLEHFTPALLGTYLVVAGVCVITFIISHLIPGDPARLLAGDRASDEIVENIRQQLGLNQPLYVQFFATSAMCFRAI